MGKIIFACDIDNTLIYSRKHPHEGWPCVEWIHEKEQAYMSPKTCQLLNEIVDRMLFVPVTSRSVEQYGRIQWPMTAKPQFAITTHGAKLFINGAEDAIWRKETRYFVSPWQTELHRMETLLADDPSFIRCRIVDETYLFVYCATGNNVKTTSNRLRAMTGLTVCAGGQKIYLLPPKLNKGTAIERLRLRYPQDRIIAAGDSVMDLDMLNAADYALFPLGLAPYVTTEGCCCPDDTLFSEFVAEIVRKE